jgi:hypothetical protein
VANPLQQAIGTDQPRGRRLSILPCVMVIDGRR